MSALSIPLALCDIPRIPRPALLRPRCDDGGGGGGGVGGGGGGFGGGGGGDGAGGNPGDAACYLVSQYRTLISVFMCVGGTHLHVKPSRPTFT